MVCLPLSHLRDLPVNDITVTAFLSEADPDDASRDEARDYDDGDPHSFSSSSRYLKIEEAAADTFGGLKLRLMNLLIQALHTETDSTNVHMLLGGLLVMVQDAALFASALADAEEEGPKSETQPSPIPGPRPTHHGPPPPDHPQLQPFDADFLNPASSSRGRSASASASASSGGGGAASSPLLRRTSSTRSGRFFESQFSEPGDTALDFFGCAVKVIQAKLNKSWKSDLSMSLSALEVLSVLSKVSLTLSSSSSSYSGSAVDMEDFHLVVNFVCSYIEEQCSRPPQNHSRDLHSMIVAAYQCLSTWLVDHPSLLQDPQILARVFEIVELGISGAKSKTGGEDGKEAAVLKADKDLRPASLRVREAAESVLSVLMEQTGMFPSPCGPESLSSLLDEALLLKQGGHYEEDEFGDEEAIKEAAMKHFRYFVIDNSLVVGLFEQPLANEQDPLPTVTLLLRGCRGKHVWTMQLRHLPRGDGISSKAWSRGVGRGAHVVVPRPVPEEAKEEVELKPKRWWPELVDHVPEVKADKSIPTLEEVLIETNGVEEHNAFLKLVQSQVAFEQSVAKAYEEETEMVRSTSPTRLDSSLECRPPQPCHEFQTARLFLSHFGFLNIDKLNDDNSAAPPPKVVALDSSSPSFLAELEQLDSLPSRAVDTAFVFYVKSGQRTADEILANANRSQAVHPYFFQLLNSLGWPVDVLAHAGWTGNVLSSWRVLESNPFQHEMSLLPNLEPVLYDGLQTVLYYGDISSEVAFVTPSLHSSDVFRACLARRPSFGDPTLDPDTLLDPIKTGLKSSELPVIAEPDFAPEPPADPRRSSSGDSSKSGGSGHASGNLGHVGKRNKFFPGKVERHRSEAGPETAPRTPARPTQSHVGVAGHSFDAGEGIRNVHKRPLSLELEQKSSEAQPPTLPTTTTTTSTTTTTTSSGTRGYRDLVTPSPVPPAETPRSRRMARQMITAAQELKVMIVWLESFEDRHHFPASELLTYHCVTGVDPVLTRRRSSARGGFAGDAASSDGVGTGVSMDFNLFILFVHPLENGLFRIHLQGPPSRPALAIPLASGMTISRRLLGSTLRQTVVHLCHRKRLDDADVNQPPAVKRRFKIQDIVAKYHDRKGDAEFLTDLFRDVASL